MRHARRHLRLGRPRAADRRRDAATGRSRGETIAEITATARGQRVKAGVAPDDALNALNGSTIGILHRRWQVCASDPGGVSDDQYHAAQAYIATVFQYAQIMGLPLPWPGTAASRPTRAEPDERTILAVRRRFADFRRALLEAGAAVGAGSRVNAAVYRVCIEDPGVEAVSKAEIQNLRYGLNAIARVAR
ncbi:MAG TPA: hypothetical protein VKX28_29375 [Xanthobacteraceae bacterium]|nr:hypothetical protein [Xanthobacteraceae bacterium]